MVTSGSPVLPLLSVRFGSREDPGSAGHSATIDVRTSVHEVPWMATTVV